MISNTMQQKNGPIITMREKTAKYPSIPMSKACLYYVLVTIK